MPDYTIVRAYERETEVFRIDRVGTSLAISPAGADSERVDKLVFFAEEKNEIRFVVPLLPATLQVERKSGGIRLGGSVRAYVLNGRTQFISLELLLRLRADGAPEFGAFAIDEWKRTSGGAVVSFDAITGLEFTSALRNRAPLFAERVGLKVPVQVAKKFSVTLRFTPELHFQLPLEVTSNRQTLDPFGVVFSPRDLMDERMDVVVRQPPPEAARRNDPRAWPSDHWIVELGVPARAAVLRWNEGVVAPYVTALRTVQDGRPVSLLPQLSEPPPKAIWTVKLSLVDRVREKHIDANQFVVRPPKTRLSDKTISIIPRTIVPETDLRDVTLEMPAFRTVGGTHDPLKIICTVSKPAAAGHEADLARGNEGFHFAIAHTRTAAEQTVRVGALDLAFSKSDAVTVDGTGVAKVSFRAAGTAEIPRVEELSLVVGALRIRPGNQDPIPGEEFNESSLAFSDPEYDASFRRASPLVIDLSEKEGGDGLVLRVEESAIEHESQTIAMKLSAPTPSVQNVDAVVIDTDPFLVARVQVDASAAEDESALTTEIGNWSNRSADLGWEIASAASGFDLVLPPQGVGESMEKRAGDFLDATGKTVPADFRFSPNARFRLRSSFFKQRFVEVPWNLRRILGYPGQRAPGAGVERLDFELLYGVSARVHNNRLRLAEVAARLGHLPGRQAPRLPWKASDRQEAIYGRYRNRWKDQYPSLLSRLAILEPYQVDREGSLALTDAEGVSYDLRAEAELADPLGRKPAQKPFLEDGLRGGWSWGFESANVLDAVLRAPRSSSALLARPFFSALGGWGHQRASFDRNLSTIYSDTAMGRTFSVSIERIGRISVLWNRAKHVIVYERTVMPSRQFAGEQDLLLGVPVLRKVREYVEILQPERTYPEFGEAPIVRGFVRASSFPEGSVRINVNSSWGEDVGRIGWKVPLWRRDADRAVYPRPSVTLHVAGDHPEKIAPLTLSEPDKLYFFTNTEASQTANSDTWPAVEAVDYPRFKDLEKPKDDFGVGKPKEHKGDVGDPVIRGNGGFTFALDPTPHATNIVDARTERPIGAILHNVTICRGPLENESAATTVDVVRDVLNEATRTVLATGASVADVKEAASKEFAKVRDELTKLVGQLPDKQLLCDRLRETVQREFDRATTANGAILPLAEQLRSVLRALRASIEAEIGRVRGEGRELDAAAREALQDARKEIHANAIVALRSVQGAAGSAARAVDFASRSVGGARNAVKSELAEIGNQLEQLDSWTEELRANVRAHARKALELIGRADQAIDDASRALTGPIPDRLRLRARDLTANARCVALRVIAATNAQATIAPKELQSELETLADEIDVKFEAVIDELTRLADEIAKRFSTTPLEVEIERVNDELETAIHTAADWDPLVTAVQTTLDDVFNRADRLVADHVERLRALVADRAKLLCDSLPDPTELRDAIVKELNDAGEAIERLFEKITPTAGDVARAIERLALDASRGVDDFANAAGKAAGEIVTSGERVFRLIRAYGEVPRVPGLGFDAERIAYHFVDVVNRIDLPSVSLSPVIARANQFLEDAAKALRPLSTGIPSIELLDRIVPFQLENFDLSSIFPHFAGLKLEGLFSNIRMPRIANDNVRVTHGFDQQAMRGWVQVDADVPFDRSLTVLSLAGITLTLVGGRFRAMSRIEARAGQPPQQTFEGEIHGEWRLHVGGFDVVSFVDTRLRFDDRGNIRFDVSPDRVKLQSVLHFVSDLMAGFGYSDSGFSIRAMPTGIESQLDLPLPDIQGGAFGLSNLRLGTRFALELLPDFAIAIRCFVAQKKAPFTITVFVLGGAGWVDARVRYIPARKEFQTKVSVGITAAASLAIAIGPIKGGVYAYFGIAVEYESSTTGVSDLRIGLLLLFRGEVSLLGFLSVSLSLALEAQYSSGGGLIGRGHVSYSIKICWLVTINVSADVSYTFGEAGSRTRALAAPPDAISRFGPAAIEFVDMFD